MQFIGPVKPEWIGRIKAEGIVPVQPVAMNAYIVGGRESAIKNVENLPYIQYTMQMHRFLKPSIGQRAEELVQLWIQLAETVETDDAVALLEEISVGAIESAQWSETERRVEGFFATKDLDLILAQPLVIGIADRPKIGLSDERAVLGLTTLVPSAGSPVPQAGKYKKWLRDLCASCSNLQGDGFYAGIADTGLDGGDRVANGDGSIPGEVSSSNLHRDELAASRIVWGQSLAPDEDTTNSKHDTIGHGTLVAGIAAGDPLATGGKDADGFFWGLGVAPSAGLAITKIDTTELATGATPVVNVTRDARTLMSPRAYWQNYSLNEYYYALQVSGCENVYRDGGYSILSRDFDAAVRDADTQTAGNQSITITTSSGNVHQQLQSEKFWTYPSSCPGLDRTLTLPPATAKNVIAVGGAENVRPDPWRCFGTRADSYTNLAMDAKHGTRIAGWHKPDLIAVTTSIASSYSNDSPTTNYCSPDDILPPVPLPYLASAGTSFAAPAGLGAAVLASRRYSADPAKAKPALVKAMLIAGAKSMRGGTDRVTLRTWKPDFQRYYQGNRVLPRVPNGRYYEVEAVGSSGIGISGSSEPAWPVGGSFVYDGSGNTRITWRDKGPELDTLAIGAFPNGQQGFGLIALNDVLSDYPMRVFVNEDDNPPVPASGSWSHDFIVHDLSRPVRIALVWTDEKKIWDTTAYPNVAPGPSMLMNDLDLSVLVSPAANCYVGNRLDGNEESIYYQPCTSVPEAHYDALNNVEIVRFSASAGQGNTTFTVKVASASGSAQDFALVVWNAYDADTVTPPPPTPSNFKATATSISPISQVSLTWDASIGATSYEVQRSGGVSDPYVTIGTPSSNSFSDSGRTPMTSYLYRVRARNTNGLAPPETQFSNWSVDPATTVLFTDPVLTAGVTTAKGIHVAELRQAVAAMRTAAELSTSAWNDDPIVAGTTLVRALHVSELRVALAEAMAALGLDVLNLTDGTLTPEVTVVKRVHIQELRDGVQ